MQTQIITMRQLPTPSGAAAARFEDVNAESVTLWLQLQAQGSGGSFTRGRKRTMQNPETASRLGGQLQSAQTLIDQMSRPAEYGADRRAAQRLLGCPERL